MLRFKTILTTLLLVIALNISFGQSSVLSSGVWYKVAVEKNGIYKLTPDQLKKMGFDINTLDPRKIQIYGNEGGMLPQANNKSRPNDLIQLAIQVTGEDDGKFDKSDFILFYAQGADRVNFMASKEVFNYESNLYSDKNVYFITIGNDNGKRLSIADNLTSSTAIIDQFNDFVYHEQDLHNNLQSGREWFGEIFDVTGGLEHIFKFDIQGIAENTDIKIISDVMAQSSSTSSFKIFYNNSLVGEQSVSGIPQSQYSIKGRHKRDTLTISSNTVAAPTTSSQEIKYQYVQGSSGSSRGFLDYFLVCFKRKLALYNDQTLFRSIESALTSTPLYNIENVNDKCRVWDVTDPYEPKQQAFTLQADVASYATTAETVREFIVFNQNIPSPELIEKVSNQNLRGTSTPQLLIVSHPDLLREAQRLASHRASHNNFNVVVVTTEQVFNEFSSGRQDVTAIRDYAKYLYDKNPGVLKSLLLFGKGSYDYKDRIANNINLVPTYESQNSLSPLETYSSDDYYGFLENEEGTWAEGTASQNHTLDIGVGRLPVKTTQEATAVVDKIIDYDINKKGLGKWRKEIVFVADDGSLSDGFTTDHQFQANSLSQIVESNSIGFDTRKIFLGAYQKQVLPSGERMPEVTNDIHEDFERGALIINYTGHGNEEQWADEKIFSNLDIDQLENKRYPFLVTATCEFGRQDDPHHISSAELSILKAKGGAIGLVTTARPVFSSTNFSLNQAFYQSLFQRESNRYLTVGEIFRRTKNNSASGVSNRNFSLLADPSLTLAMPSLSIVVNQIETTTGSDTLKALSTVIVKGNVQDGEGMASYFNGTLEATLYDKQTEFTTIGKNDPSYKFKQWHNALFRGKAIVKDGEFEFEFIVPKNISYEIGEGKLTLYAFDTNNFLDAGGASSTFKIGGSEPFPTGDITPPAIKLFMGDTTFVNGGITSANTTLIVGVHDASGINISNYGIGNTMIAVLDNDAQTYVLNEYFIAEENDYTKGWIHFPLKDITPGKHTLTVKVWDTYNNGSQATIDFVVTDGDLLQIESFANYPNPFQAETMLYFTHNHSGDDLQAQIYLYSIAGDQIKAYDFTILSSPYKVNLLEINGLTDFEKKLPAGVYFARLVVRSLTNGSKNEQVTKLIIVN